MPGIAFPLRPRPPLQPLPFQPEEGANRKGSPCAAVLSLRRRRRTAGQMARLRHLVRRDRRVVRGRVPGEVHGRAGQRVDLVPAGRRRVDQGADRRRRAAGRRARPGGDPLPPRERADRGRQGEDRRRRQGDDRAAVPRRRGRRRDRGGRWAERCEAPAPPPPAEGCGGPTTTIPGQPGDFAPFVGPVCSQDGKAALVFAYVKGDGEADAPGPGPVLARDRVQTRAAGSRSRSPAPRATRPTRSRSSRASTARCCSRRRCW